MIYAIKGDDKGCRKFHSRNYALALLVAVFMCGCDNDRHDSVQIKTNLMSCPQCGGLGALPCVFCNGAGKVQGLVNGPYGLMPGIVPCNGCVAVGLPSARICNACGGTGKMSRKSPSFTGRACQYCSCGNFKWDGTPGYSRCTCGHVH